MATKDTGGQQRGTRRAAEADQTVEQEQAGEDLKERQEALDDDVDSILDEIDEVLEENAEEFVKGFVQKGGQ
jgi:prokaryotic ubiquitin-like protein Pup